jgi:hypothetical protein
MEDFRYSVLENRMLWRIFGPEGERNRRLEKLHVCTHARACMYTCTRAHTHLQIRDGVGGYELDFVAQDSDQLHPIMITVMNLQVPYKVGSNVKE